MSNLSPARVVHFFGRDLLHKLQRLGLLRGFDGLLEFVIDIHFSLSAPSFLGPRHGVAPCIPSGAIMQLLSEAAVVFERNAGCLMHPGVGS